MEHAGCQHLKMDEESICILSDWPKNFRIIVITVTWVWYICQNGEALKSDITFNSNIPSFLAFTHHSNHGPQVSVTSQNADKENVHFLLFMKSERMIFRILNCMKICYFSNMCRKVVFFLSTLL